MAAAALALTVTTQASADIWYADYSHFHRLSFLTNGAMDNANSRQVNGNPVILYARTNNPNQWWQHWVRDTDLAEVYYTNAGASDYVITGHGSTGLAYGARIYVHQYAPFQQNNQRWYPARYNSGNGSACALDPNIPRADLFCTAYLSVVSTNMCIDDPNSTNQSGTQYWAYGCNGTNAQLFQENAA
ncbi:RICIN domain-containing protein [Acrocarpospora corrugata]|uniref:RICIN domain-containing protein n=1 Tax=Acrocarpospora corrugata TaxID=35763 RepID=UPI0012D2BB7D|nr:hypothetical protein [Acrocarpospora corrugata]